MRVKKYYKMPRRDRRGVFLLPLLFFFLFPYIVSNFSAMEKQNLVKEVVPGEIWVIQKKIWGEQKIPLEKYLEGMMAATIPAEYHIEALKAQGIILRTFCMSQVEKRDGSKVIRDDKIKELYYSPAECQRLWQEEWEEKEKKMRQALKETKGIIVVSEERLPSLPFVRISNGYTRDIAEYVLSKDEYSYMKTVACPEDEQSEEYLQYMELSVQEFQKKFQKLLENKNTSEKITLYRDSAGYVKEVVIGEEKIDGEIFKKALGLVSTCFYIEKIDDVVQIRTKGIGHGFGFSQYSADKMAKTGCDYSSLLNYFFQNISLEKF